MISMHQPVDGLVAWGIRIPQYEDVFDSLSRTGISDIFKPFSPKYRCIVIADQRGSTAAASTGVRHFIRGLADLHISVPDPRTVQERLLGFTGVLPDLALFMGIARRSFGQAVELQILASPDIEVKDEWRIWLNYRAATYDATLSAIVDSIMDNYPQRLCSSRIWVPLLTDYRPM